ncbi:HEAT repeat domain-containing protein [Leifsonia sp. A12D58]|uniref:HEAT repeat domain-containing protein n=1 Tax=Leifsonia sp. A12D58 TaxID=3397674 RepID=UPI0039E08FD4
MRAESESQPTVPVDLPLAERLDAAVARYTEAGVLSRAVALTEGAMAGEDFLLYVGGRHAQGLLDGAPALYWPELWGMRALLHVWDPSAGTAVKAGLENQAWRVREMAARVSQERELNVASSLVTLLTDESARVRAAAAHALGACGREEDLPALEARLRDPDKDVRRAAQQGRDQLRRRFPQPTE